MYKAYSKKIYSRYHVIKNERNHVKRAFLYRKNNFEILPLSKTFAINKIKNIRIEISIYAFCMVDPMKMYHNKLQNVNMGKLTLCTKIPWSDFFKFYSSSQLRKKNY